jgi:hypothetical protein
MAAPETQYNPDGYRKTDIPSASQGILTPAPKTVDETQEAMREPSPNTEPAMVRKAQRASVIRGRGEMETPPPMGLLGPPVEYGADGFRKTDTSIPHPSISEPDDPSVERLATNPTYETKEEEGFHVRDVAKFLAGPEMAVLGMKWDKDGFDWEVANAKQQWSEQPLWLNLAATSSLFGTAAFPIAKAAYNTAKFGKVGEALGLFGHEADEAARWKKMGVIDDTMNHKDLSPETRKAFRMFENNTEKGARINERAAKYEAGAPMSPAERVLHKFESNFSNTYFNNTADLNSRAAFNVKLSNLYKTEKLGQFFKDIPDEVGSGERMYQYNLHMSDPTNIPHPTGMSAAEKGWAENLGQHLEAHQSESVAEGFMTQETVDRVGKRYQPALYKGTPEPNFAPTTQVYSQTEQGVKLVTIPKMNADTLRSRGADLPEVYRRLQANQLITDPHDLTTRGYLSQRFLLHNFRFIRDTAMDARYAIRHEDILTKFTDAAGKFDSTAAKRAGFVNLHSVGADAVPIMQRMIKKAGGSLGVNEELPWIRKEIFDEVFGEHGMFSQTAQAVNSMDIMSSIFKSMKTVTSIPSHFNNGAGNGVFLSMAGFNPLDPKSIDLMHSMAGSFGKISAGWDAAKQAGVLRSRDILDKTHFDLGSISVHGRTFDLNKELLSPITRELIEENSLNATEAFGHLERLYEQTKAGSMKRSAIAAALKVKNYMNKGPGLFDKMTKAYVAEDMIPKLSYYMHLRGKGFSQAAAVIETGRRLPMYNTVGSMIKAARKTAFPWATFSTEALRITKNNLMDYPLRAMPWLHFPGIAQSLMSGMEGRNYDEVQEAKRQSPLFAQTGTTVMTSGQNQATAGGAATGGLLGAVGGAVVGGAGGAAVGGLMGAAVGGGAMRAMTGGDHGKELRAAVLNFLPHSAFMMKSNSPDIDWNLRSALEQMPSEPLAIVKPLMDVMAGQTAWGQDIGHEGFGDEVGHAISGMIGMMAPPFIQKYGFKTTTPDITASQWASQKLGLGTRGIPGDITNVSRLLTDTGIEKDAVTGKSGSFSQDFILDNFGVWKSYASKPADLLSNEDAADKNTQKVRTYLSKNLAFNLVNGHDEEAQTILEKVQKTFAKQYVGDPRQAQKSFDKWLKNELKSVGQHPRLRSFSEEELKKRIRLASDFAGENRGQARDEMINFLRNELSIRKLGTSEKQTKGAAADEPSEHPGGRQKGGLM